MDRHQAEDDEGEHFGHAAFEQHRGRLSKCRAAARSGCSAMTLFSGINVVSIPVPDLDAARAFYRDKLELGEPLYDLPEMGWVEFGSGAASGNIALTLSEPGWRPAAGATLVLDTANFHATR